MSPQPTTPTVRTSRPCIAGIAPARTVVGAQAYNQRVPRRRARALRQSSSARIDAGDRFRGLPVIGFAVAGLAVGHVLSYVIAVPDPYHRDLLLQRTGHDYLPAFGQAALMLFLAAVAMVVFRTSRRRARGGEGYASLASRLALVQVGAFVAQELAERLLAGSELQHLGQGNVLLVGLGAQVAMALAGAALLRWLARASGRLAEILRSALSLPRPVPSFALPASSDRASGRIDVRSPGQRAPPSA
jgi:hypothetical protein